MITVGPATHRGGSDVAATAKHAERALRNVAATGMPNDTPERHEGRRFDYVLARRLVAA
jgi:hypothetical protein